MSGGLDEYQVECEECGIETFILTLDYPEYCPHCGCKCHIVKTDEEDDGLIYM